MRSVYFVLIIALMTAFAACGGSSSPTGNSATPVIKEGVAPVADDEVAVIEMENTSAFGTMTIELYSNIAPQAVARFKELAKEGFYDGVTFHRVNDTVIQGGDPNSKDDDPTNDGQGRSNKPNVPAEFSDIEYASGIVGAARSTDPNSANSQFFITLKREPQFDRRYTVFGKVIDGMNNARIISGVKPKEGERPVEDVKIKTIRIEAKK